MRRALRFPVGLVVALMLLTGRVQAQVVERVVDGDTIVVRGIGTVRLIGIDTPETVDPRKPVEYFGQEASIFLKRLVEGQTVRLEYDQQRTDRYNRTLAYVYLADGTFVNAEIVRQGYGHAYTAFPFKYLEQFRTLQREAMNNNRGLWAPRSTSPAASAPTAAAPAPATPKSTASADENVTVYVTRTGTKYHRAGCRYLARSQIPMSLREAAARYGPCSVCNPPVARSGEQPAATPPSGAPTTVAPAPRPAPASPGRCQAITQKGTQCSRRAQPGSIYCWQHGR